MWKCSRDIVVAPILAAGPENIPEWLDYEGWQVLFVKGFRLILAELQLSQNHTNPFHEYHIYYVRMVSST